MSSDTYGPQSSALQCSQPQEGHPITFPFTETYTQRPVSKVQPEIHTVLVNVAQM